MARLIDGKAMAARLREETKKTVAARGQKPTLAAILVGDDPASRLYVSLKEKAAAEVGIGFEKHLLSAVASETEILEVIKRLNARSDIDAILVQLPLPSPLDEDRIIAAIDPGKDADGFHPRNLEAVSSGQPFLMPVVSEVVMRIIRETGVKLQDKQALLLVNSYIFAQPLAAALTAAGMDVKVLKRPFAREAAKDLALDSAVIVTAVGEAGTVTGEMVNDGTIVVDVGTNRLPDGKVVGDVTPGALEDHDVWLTPVPGGVGPMTVAMLLARTLELAEKRGT